MSNEVYSRQMLSGEYYNGFEERESHNKYMNSFFRHHKFYTTQRTVFKTVAVIVYAEAIKRRTEHGDMLKLFSQTDFINRVDLTGSTYKTSYCAKLSQKNLPRLI